MPWLFLFGPYLGWNTETLCDAYDQASFCELSFFLIVHN